MSEYQYYEFQAIDRPLSEADRQALGALSSRARITATSFTNFYEWGDFKGDPANLMERWFDLHVYVANWGSRRLMIRLPSRLVDQRLLQDFLAGLDFADLHPSDENLILDICDDPEPDDDWDDGSGWAAALAPLRSDVLGGDLRLFYLLWLRAVQTEAIDADKVEPLSGLAPMKGALEALSSFLRIDPDLVQAAAERSAGAAAEPAPPDAVNRIIAQLPDHEKNAFLSRLVDGDHHVMNELRRMVRNQFASGPGNAQVAGRSADDLRSRADAIRRSRERAEAAKAAAERKRQAELAEKARRARLDAISRRGDEVWAEVEAEIERRNPAGYEKAAGLLADLQAIADERDAWETFASRLQSIRERHARKGQFIKRLNGLE